MGIAEPNDCVRSVVVVYYLIPELYNVMLSLAEALMHRLPGIGKWLDVLLIQTQTIPYTLPTG